MRARRTPLEIVMSRPMHAHRDCWFALEGPGGHCFSFLSWTLPPPPEKRQDQHFAHRSVVVRNLWPGRWADRDESLTLPSCLRAGSMKSGAEQRVVVGASGGLKYGVLFGLRRQPRGKRRRVNPWANWTARQDCSSYCCIRVRSRYFCGRGVLKRKMRQSSFVDWHGSLRGSERSGTTCSVERTRLGLATTGSM